MLKSGKYFSIVLLAFLLTSCTMKYTPASIQTCKLNLHLFIHQGASANVTYSGQVAFGSSTSSSFKGDFEEEGGTSRPISFYSNGQSVQFILASEKGNIYGTGIMETSLAVCSGTGGGTQTGPVVSDLGDWRGEWISESIPNPNPQPQSSKTNEWFDVLNFLCLSILAIIVILFLSLLFKNLAPYKFKRLFKKPPLKNGETSKFTMRRPDQNARLDSAGNRPPLVEYLATYTSSDNLFDESFDIQRSGRYEGECGIIASNLLDKHPRQANAFEIWLFDTRSAQTETKFLMGEFCYKQEHVLKEAANKGQVLLIHPGLTANLETQGLIAKAQILEMEYEPNSPNPMSVFKKVVIKIEVRTAG